MRGAPPHLARLYQEQLGRLVGVSESGRQPVRQRALLLDDHQAGSLVRVGRGVRGEFAERGAADRAGVGMLEQPDGPAQCEQPLDVLFIGECGDAHFATSLTRWNLSAPLMPEMSRSPSSMVRSSL